MITREEWSDGSIRDITDKTAEIVLVAIAPQIL